MTREEHLVDILIEECAEVIQRLTKIKRFGMNEVQPGQDKDNVARLVYEMNDLEAVMHMLVPGWRDNYAQLEKQKKVEHFLKYSKECGTLEEDKILNAMNSVLKEQPIFKDHNGVAGTFSEVFDRNQNMLLAEINKIFDTVTGKK